MVVVVVVVVVVAVAVDKHQVEVVPWVEPPGRSLETVSVLEPVFLKESQPVSVTEPQTVFVAALRQIVFVAARGYQLPRSGRRC